MNETRRSIIGAGLALAGGMSGWAAVSAGSGTQAGGASSKSAGRIDVHQHLLPPEFLAALEKRNLSAQWAPVTWSSDGALAMMDEH